MQQHLLARQQAAQLEQVEPGGGVDLRQHRGLLQTQPLGHRQGVAGIHHHLLGHAAAGQQRAHPVAHAPATAGPHLADHSGALQTQHRGHARRRRVQAVALQQVGSVETGGRHANADLPDIAFRARLRAPLQLPLDTLQCVHATSILLNTRCPLSAPESAAGLLPGNWLHVSIPPPTPYTGTMEPCVFYVA
ncbi:hypothetical protein D3C78_1217620 [compost metagenome]